MPTNPPSKIKKKNLTGFDSKEQKQYLGFMPKYKYEEFSNTLYRNSKVLKKNYTPSLDDYDVLLDIVCSKVAEGSLASDVVSEFNIPYGEFVNKLNSNPDYKKQMSESEVTRSYVLEDKLLKLASSLSNAEDAVEVSRVKTQIDTIKYVMGISGNSKYSKEGVGELEAEAPEFTFMGFGMCHNQDKAIENYKSRYGISEQVDLVQVMDWFKSRWDNPNDSVFKEEVVAQTKQELDDEYNNYTM